MGHTLAQLSAPIAVTSLEDISACVCSYLLTIWTAHEGWCACNHSHLTLRMEGWSERSHRDKLSVVCVVS